MPYLLEDTTINDILKTVEEFHERKDFAGAVSILEKHRADLPDGLWHFNMGTLQARLENWPLARFHFLMAEEAGFSHEVLSINKSIAEEKLSTSKLEKPITTSDYAIKAGLLGAGGIFTTLSLIFLLLGLLSLWKKNSLRVFSGFLLAGMIVLGLNLWVKGWSRQIVIIAVPLFEGPSAIFQSRGEIPPGVMLVTTENGNWHKVLFPSRYQGWIKSADLKELK